MCYVLILSVRTREVVFPRFKLEQNYDLIEHLKEMGMTDIFTEKGDFSPMTSEKVIINWVREQQTHARMQSDVAFNMYCTHFRKRPQCLP